MTPATNPALQPAAGPADGTRRDVPPSAGRDEGMRTPPRREHHYTGGYMATVVLAIVLAVFGLLLLAGGIWLITLGGSWYYAIAGLGLCVTAFFLMQPSMMALWVYLATWIGTVIWAIWEVGLDPWLQVPRLVAPTVVLLLVLLTIPVLRAGVRTRPEQPHDARSGGTRRGV